MQGSLTFYHHHRDLDPEFLQVCNLYSTISYFKQAISILAHLFYNAFFRGIKIQENTLSEAQTEDTFSRL